MSDIEEKIKVEYNKVLEELKNYTKKCREELYRKLEDVKRKVLK